MVGGETERVDILARYINRLMERVDTLERQAENLLRESVAQAKETSALRVALIESGSDVNLPVATVVPFRPVASPAYREPERRRTASVSKKVPLRQRDPVLAARLRRAMDFA